LLQLFAAHAFTTNLSQASVHLACIHNVLSSVPVESLSPQAAAMGLDLPVRTFNGTDALDGSFPNLLKHLALTEFKEHLIHVCSQIHGKVSP